MYNPHCLSSFLTFRYLVDDNLIWKDEIKSILPKPNKAGQKKVNSAEEIIDFFTENLYAEKNTGILLSSGIDSAILASFLPAETKAYTIRFVSEEAIDESRGAAVFASQLNLEHKIIDVSWADYLKYTDELMLRKKSPLHAIEVALYKTAMIAKQDGVEFLIVGNGADTTFGGMDKLLSKDWAYNEFKNRYTFVNPFEVLNVAVDMDNVYNQYKVGNGINVTAFLKNIHGLGIVQSFNNAIEAAGCGIIAPYESLFFNTPLDFNRIRSGESKYVLRKVFKMRFPDITIPEKIPFARPMDKWLADWEGPTRSEFLDNIDIKKFTGDQKWILYCLERFMNLFDK